MISSASWVSRQIGKASTLGELLEQHRLALHHRHRRLGADVAEAEHGAAVGDDGDGVLLDRELEGLGAVVVRCPGRRGRRRACRPSRGRRGSSAGTCCAARSCRRGASASCGRRSRGPGRRGSSRSRAGSAPSARGRWASIVNSRTRLPSPPAPGTRSTPCSCPPASAIAAVSLPSGSWRASSSTRIVTLYWALTAMGGYRIRFGDRATRAGRQLGAGRSNTGDERRGLGSVAAYSPLCGRQTPPRATLGRSPNRRVGSTAWSTCAQLRRRCGSISQRGASPRRSRPAAPPASRRLRGGPRRLEPRGAVDGGGARLREGCGRSVIEARRRCGAAAAARRPDRRLGSERCGPSAGVRGIRLHRVLHARRRTRRPAQRHPGDHARPDDRRPASGRAARSLRQARHPAGGDLGLPARRIEIGDRPHPQRPRARLPAPLPPPRPSPARGERRDRALDRSTSSGASSGSSSRPTATLPPRPRRLRGRSRSRPRPAAHGLRGPPLHRTAGARADHRRGCVALPAL